MKYVRRPLRIRLIRPLPLQTRIDVPRVQPLLVESQSRRWTVSILHTIRSQNLYSPPRMFVLGLGCYHVKEGLA
jgi:hypothetical protein